MEAPPAFEKGGTPVDIITELHARGFARVIVLDGPACGYPEAESVLLAVWPYEAEASPDRGAWVHPYYRASQQAYEAASAMAKAHAEEGVALRDDIRVKPIFARLAGFSQGRNTLSCLESFGSRFHVQILTMTPGIPATHRLDAEEHPRHCGSCRKCVEACPTNALENGVFHRERCLRNWQMSGQPVPEELRIHMGSLLIGCDVCQQVCPHNAPAKEASSAPLDMAWLLSSPKEAAQMLRPQIGANLSIPNRLLGQACLMAGCKGDASLLPRLTELSKHPSPTVAAHAAWAAEQIRLKHL